MSAIVPEDGSAREAAWHRWVKSRRQRKLLRATECAACIAAGILIGRGYSVATAPEPPSPWWTLSFGQGGRIVGPVTLLGASGSVKLKLPAGGELTRNSGGGLLWDMHGAKGGELGNLQIMEPDAGEESEP